MAKAECRRRELHHPSMYSNTAVSASAVVRSRKSRDGCQPADIGCRTPEGLPVAQRLMWSPGIVPLDQAGDLAFLPCEVYTIGDGRPRVRTGDLRCVKPRRQECTLSRADTTMLFPALNHPLCFRIECKWNARKWPYGLILRTGQLLLNQSCSSQDWERPDFVDMSELRKETPTCPQPDPPIYPSCATRLSSLSELSATLPAWRVSSSRRRAPSDTGLPRPTETPGYAATD